MDRVNLRFVAWEDVSRPWFNISTGHQYVSPPTPPCASTADKQNPTAASWSRSQACPSLPWRTRNEVRPSQERHSSDTKYWTVQNYTIAFTVRKRSLVSRPSPSFLQATESWARAWDEATKNDMHRNNSLQAKPHKATSKLQLMQNSQSYRDIGPVLSR